MNTRTIVIVLMVAVLALFSGGCDDSSKSANKQKPPPAKKAEAPKPQPEPAPAKEEKRNWPYITGEYKVPVADNLLARNFVLIFDGSGSMQDVDCSGGLTKCEAAKAAVMEWTKSIPPQANLGLVVFQSGSNQLTVQDIRSGSRDNFTQTVQSIQPGGKTPLSNAFQSAYGMIEKQAQSQLGYGDYTIVAVTDGAANDPARLTKVVNAILALSPVNIYTIGFCIGGDHSLNQKGRIFYKAADNPEQLRQGLSEVLAESDEFDVTEFN